MSERIFTCRICRQDRVSASATGALPSVCDNCNPDAARRRAAQAQAAERQRDSVRRMRERLAAYEAADGGRIASPELLAVQKLLNDPDMRGIERRDIVTGVTRLGHARGEGATYQALLRLAALCLAWARRLSAKGASPHAEAHPKDTTSYLDRAGTSAAAATTSPECAGRQPTKQRHLRVVA